MNKSFKELLRFIKAMNKDDSKYDLTEEFEKDFGKEPGNSTGILFTVITVINILCIAFILAMFVFY